MTQLPFFKEISLPKSSDRDEWADYTEIRCLLNADGFFTLDALADDVEDAEAVGDSPMAELLATDEDEFKSGDLFPEIPPEEYEAMIPSKNPRDEQKIEKKYRELRAVFGKLEARAAYLGDVYPFEIESGKQIKILPYSSHHARKTYILLLISSNLRLATPSGITRIGNLFEQICGPFFKLFLPNKGEYYHFGAAAGEKAIFKGGLDKKLEKMCEVFKTRKSQRADVGKIATSGDGGLDWIGFQKFKDRPWNIPVYFAQCACGENYLDKQIEASKLKWNSLIDLEFPIFTFLFTPRCHRGLENEIERPENIISELVMVDRFRLIEMLEWDETIAPKSVAIYQQVFDEFFKLVESI